jgi:hypothetical protein
LYTSSQQKNSKYFQYNKNFIVNKKSWYSIQLYNINYIILQLESDKTIPQETMQGFKYLKKCIKDFLSNFEDL